MKQNRGGSRDFITPAIETLVKKVKVNTTYQVIGEGTTSGYGVEQGLVSRMGFGGHNTEITGDEEKKAVNGTIKMMEWARKII